jgi:hypothetical protein
MLDPMALHQDYPPSPRLCLAPYITAHRGTYSTLLLVSILPFWKDGGRGEKRREEGRGMWKKEREKRKGRGGEEKGQGGVAPTSPWKSPTAAPLSCLALSQLWAEGGEPKGKKRGASGHRVGGNPLVPTLTPPTIPAL